MAESFGVHLLFVQNRSYYRRSVSFPVLLRSKYNLAVSSGYIHTSVKKGAAPQQSRTCHIYKTIRYIYLYIKLFNNISLTTNYLRMLSLALILRGCPNNAIYRSNGSVEKRTYAIYIFRGGHASHFPWGPHRDIQKLDSYLLHSLYITLYVMVVLFLSNNWRHNIGNTTSNTIHAIDTYTAEQHHNFLFISSNYFLNDV